MRNEKTIRGFTLFEIIIAISIVAILSTVVIPLSKNIIDNAQYKNEVDTVKQLNHYIKDMIFSNGKKKPQNASEARELILKVSSSFDFCSKVVEKGYHFLYDLENAEIKIEKIDVVNTVNASKLSSNTAAMYSKLPESMIFTNSSYVLLDTHGSLIAEVIDLFYKVIDQVSFNELDDKIFEIINDETYTQEEKSRIILYYDSTVFVTNSGSFMRKPKTVATNVIFANNIERVKGYKVDKYGNRTQICGENPLAILSKDIIVPRSLIYAFSGSLIFKIDGNAKIILEGKTLSNILANFEAHFTNAIFEVNGILYKLNDNNEVIEVKDQNGSEIGPENPSESEGELDYINKVVSFDVESTANTIFAIDELNSDFILKLYACNFVFLYPDLEVSTNEVIWTSSNNSIASIDNTGVVTFMLPYVSGKVTFTATSISGDVSSSITIEISEIIDFDLSIDGQKVVNNYGMTFEYDNYNYQNANLFNYVVSNITYTNSEANHNTSMYFKSLNSNIIEINEFNELIIKSVGNTAIEIGFNDPNYSRIKKIIYIDTNLKDYSPKIILPDQLEAVWASVTSIQNYIMIKVLKGIEIWDYNEIGAFVKVFSNDNTAIPANLSINAPENLSSVITRYDRILNNTSYAFGYGDIVNKRGKTWNITIDYLYHGKHKDTNKSINVYINDRINRKWFNGFSVAFKNWDLHD